VAFSARGIVIFCTNRIVKSREAVILATLRTPKACCMPDADTSSDLRRRDWRVTGQVQGVGFRPFIYRLATELGLSGTVCNDPRGVTIEALGPAERLDDFAQRIVADAPALAHVAKVACRWDEEIDSDELTGDFVIIASDSEPAERGRVTVDSAVCPDCLRELLDERDRRYRHALINCTNCGPRYTIVRDLPYDRPLTTMVSFEMCSACAAEYGDPGNRRFHAQPTCCPDCGPTLRLCAAGGADVAGDPIDETARLLREGRIAAIKGIGGYHLVVDACNDEAVRRLRERKRRDAKPFALMFAGLEQAGRYVDLSDEAAGLLVSPIAPIVLAPRKTVSDTGTEFPAPERCITDAVAPGCHRLGVMLPYTPIQHLLLAGGVGPLVMTSANLSDEPLVSDDAEALTRLEGIADFFLTHDRPIERAVDDSVVLDSPRGPVPFRRARGYVPTPLSVPIGSGKPGLCLGADLKNTVALVRGKEVILSHHIGDLEHAQAHRWFEKTIDDLLRLYDVKPAWLACDMHPGYHSRRYAEKLARQWELPLIAVQHHHAHLASLLAEHGRADRVIGVVCDGVGHGTDGISWGGEVFLSNLDSYERASRLRPLRLPGGDKAAKEITRCALSWLDDALGDELWETPLAERIEPDERKREAIRDMLAGNLNCPRSSGAGRLFDAVAALIGVCDRNAYEAMSGTLLEAQASKAAPPRVVDAQALLPLVPCAADEPPLEMDTRPLARELVERLQRGEPAPQLAAFFHAALAAGLTDAALEAGDSYPADTVALTGGVFCNALLTRLVCEQIEAVGLTCLTHRQVPPGDGGIALGQAAVASAVRQEEALEAHIKSIFQPRET
jgi:hydrogenase maturation protein HypF